MTESPSERHARETLQNMGFQVERIPCGKTRTADYRVADADFTYLVEVSRREEGEFLTLLRADARADGVADGSRRLRYSNALDGKIREKAEQLAQTPGRADFRVLWIAAFHDDWGFLMRILKSTLVGYAKLGALRAGHEGLTVLDCIYYHQFSFRRLPMLDAVVLSTEAGGCMFVNALSARAADFRASKFYGMLGKKATLDPSDLREGVLIVDAAIDRSRPLAQWQYLKDHYGLSTTEMVEVEWRGLASIPIEAEATDVDPQ